MGQRPGQKEGGKVHHSPQGDSRQQADRSGKRGKHQIIAAVRRSCTKEGAKGWFDKHRKESQTNSYPQAEKAQGDEKDQPIAQKGTIGHPLDVQLRAGDQAEKAGYSQVLWLDGVHRKYIEEVGAMNVMFKVAGKILTPDLNGSVLDGITRRSCIQLLKDWGYEVEERRISAEELFEAARNGAMEEAWGTGTAAVVSPIGELAEGDEKVIINNNEIGPVTQKLYDELTGIQWGRNADPHDWIMKL